MTEDVLGGFFAGFVKPIHVQLSDEAVDVAMPEILGEDDFLELVDIFDGKFLSIVHPADDLVVLAALYHEAMRYIDDLIGLEDEVCHR